MVAKTYTCDRCGKEKKGHIVTDIMVSNKETRDIGWIRLMSRSGYKNDLDLCEECLKSFKNWFERSQSL